MEWIKDRDSDIWVGPVSNAGGRYTCVTTEGVQPRTLDELAEAFGPLERATWTPYRQPCPHASVTHSTEWCGCTCPGEGIVLGKGVISGK